MRRIWRVPAKRIKRDFESRIDDIVKRRATTPRELEASVYSYCGAGSFLDQVVTLRSFLRGIGAPKRFTVVSDGTLTASHREQLRANHPCVECRELRELDVAPPPALAALVEEKMPGYFFAPKLLLLLAISLHPEPAIYSDSDVLFFPSPDVSPLLDFADELWYLKDCLWSLDPPLLAPEFANEGAGIAPVNAGFGLYGRKVQWEDALGPLRRFGGTPEHVSEQTIIHNMMHFNNAHQLPSDRFLLEVADKGLRPEPAQKAGVVLRHYVAAVRHKMWLHAPEFYK